MSARTLGQDLRAAAAECPTRQAVVAPDRTLSYAELDAAADRVAGVLAELGVQRGDRVALVLPNSADMAQAIYGVTRAGAAFTPLNATIKEAKLARVLEHAGVTAVVCDGERQPTVQAAVERIGEVAVIADVSSLEPVGVPPFTADPHGAAPNGTVPRTHHTLDRHEPL